MRAGTSVGFPSLASGNPRWSVTPEAHPAWIPVLTCSQGCEPDHKGCVPTSMSPRSASCWTLDMSDTFCLELSLPAWTSCGTPMFSLLVLMWLVRAHPGDGQRDSLWLRVMVTCFGRRILLSPWEQYRASCLFHGILSVSSPSSLDFSQNSQI